MHLYERNRKAHRFSYLCLIETLHMSRIIHTSLHTSYRFTIKAGLLIEWSRPPRDLYSF